LKQRYLLFSFIELLQDTLIKQFLFQVINKKVITSCYHFFLKNRGSLFNLFLLLFAK